jgi:hypothetical protein
VWITTSTERGILGATGASRQRPRRARTACARLRSSGSVSCQPMQASVIDTPAVQRHARHQVLPAGVQVAFDHHADDAALTGGDLPARSAATAI